MAQARAVHPARSGSSLGPYFSYTLARVVEGDPERLVLQKVAPGAALTVVDLDAVQPADAFLHEREHALVRVGLDAPDERHPYRGRDVARATRVELPGRDRVRRHLRRAALIEAVALAAFAYFVTDAFWPKVRLLF